MGPPMAGAFGNSRLLAAFVCWLRAPARPHPATGIKPIFSWRERSGKRHRSIRPGRPASVECCGQATTGLLFLHWNRVFGFTLVEMWP